MSYRPKYSLVTKISRINDINEGRSGWLEEPSFEAHYPVLSNIRCSTSNNTQTNFKTTGCIYQEAPHLTSPHLTSPTITSDMITTPGCPGWRGPSRASHLPVGLLAWSPAPSLQIYRLLCLAGGRLVDMKQEK